MAPFLALGVPRSSVTFGHVVADECARLGIAVEDYLGRYDTSLAPPYPGAAELVLRLDRWAVCSNKVRWAGEAELARLGWAPEVALFAEDFAGAPKSVLPVLERMGVDPATVVFVGDTAHDRRCALEAGVSFALAGWNPRATAEDGDLVLASPLELLAFLAFSAE